MRVLSAAFTSNGTCNCRSAEGGTRRGGGIDGGGSEVPSDARAEAQLACGPLKDDALTTSSQAPVSRLWCPGSWTPVAGDAAACSSEVDVVTEWFDACPHPNA